MQAAAGRGAPGEVDCAGDRLRTWRRLRPGWPDASSESDPRTCGWKVIGDGRCGPSGCRGCPRSPPRSSAATSYRPEPSALAGAKGERPSQAACSWEEGALRSEPGSLQPSAPLASPSPSGSPPLLLPLAVLSWGERVSTKLPRLPQHGGRSALLRLGLGQQRPPPPARPRAGAPVCALRLAELERGSEGEPRVGAAGTARTPAQRRTSCRGSRGRRASSLRSEKGSVQGPLHLQRARVKPRGMGVGRGAPLRRQDQPLNSYVSPLSPPKELYPIPLESSLVSP